MTTRERDENRQLAHLHDVLAARLAMFPAAVDVQGTLWKRIPEGEGVSGGER